MSAPERPKPSRRVNTSSNHEVCQWIDQQIAARNLKSCTHLLVERVEERRETSETTFFIPVCKEKSFEWGLGPYGLNDEQELIYLKFQLQDNPIRCPANCFHYRNAGWARGLKRMHKVKSALDHLLVAPFQWFATLPSAQVWAIFGTIAMAVLLTILIKLPTLVPLLTQLLKAYHGQ
jgi:hypothetical protein